MIVSLFQRLKDNDQSVLDEIKHLKGQKATDLLNMLHNHKQLYQMVVAIIIKEHNY